MQQAHAYFFALSMCPTFRAGLLQHKGPSTKGQVLVQHPTPPIKPYTLLHQPTVTAQACLTTKA